MRRRRRTDTFGLSFLDCICCGFGAVILFYVMMSAQGGLRGLKRESVLQSEVDRLTARVTAGTRDLAVLRSSIAAREGESARIDAGIDRITAEILAEQQRLSTSDADSLAHRARIEQLKADIVELEAGERRLAAGGLEPGAPGQETRLAAAEQDPRFVTGLTLTGKRILILLDRSASMLHEDVVSVIRLRNTSDATKRAAAKWRRTVRIVEWLITQMPAHAQYQIYAFNTAAQPLVAGSDGRWLDAGDGAAFVHATDALRQLVPEHGTSLINAFAAVKALKPLADQIILITDGLPTQGRTAGTRRFIDAGARAQLFDQAIATLPARVPVDTVLMPMDGDVEAAHEFWRLARLSRGAMLAPAKDWP
ncbi:MAG TPA: hypothetical protein VMU67_04665 [Steroidobacteraceae bacterium]|nr:hypothetical protein [Steroidobacteraceae bacterium]